MKTLIFASNNAHKLSEIQAAIGNNFKIQTLKEAGINIDIPEPYETLKENAATKAQTIFKLTGKDCFSEDSGLEVAALNGEPGVKSARYAQNDPAFDNNIDKLLYHLKGKTDRSARFVTIIDLIINGREYFFEGICEGTIAEKTAGEKGFGYDPVFVPRGSDQTFAQMTLLQKNELSHRTKATLQLIDFLSPFGK